MTHIRKLASALLLVFLSITHLSSNCQDLTSGELLNRGYVGAWTNTVGGQNGGYSGGYTPAYNASTDTVIFGYTTSSVSQTKAISSALQGTGIQVTGYNYSWSIGNSGTNSGTLTGVVSLKGSGGNVLESYSYNYDRETSKLPDVFQQFSGTQSFSQIYGADVLDSISVTFTGKDNRYWAGLYGPRVRDPHLSLNYRSDPCATNPAFGPQCAGFNDLLTSINLVPYPTGVATGSNFVDNSFPIATVMSSSGSGLTLHGFKYGFVYDLKDPYCSSGFLIFCTGTTDNVARVTAGATDASGRLVFNNQHVFQGANTGPQEMNYQYLFPTSTNTNLMGHFHFGAAVEGNGSIYNMYSKMIVTPDPCIKNVMYSPTCTGFQEAIDKLSGTNKTDYATTGYTEPASVTAGTASAEAITYTSSPSGSTVNVQPVPPPVAPVTASSSSTSSSITSVASVSVGSTSEKSAGGSPVNLSFALNLISKNAEKEKSIAMSAVATAIEQAQAAGTQAQQEAVSVATKAVEASTSTSSTGSSSSGSTQTGGDTRTASGGNGLSLQGSAGMGAVQLQSNPQMISFVTTTSNSQTVMQMQQAQQVSAPPPIMTQITQQSFAAPVNYSIVPSMQVASIAPTMSAITFSETTQSVQSSQIISINRTPVDVEVPSNSTSFLIDRTNPLREIINAQPIIAGTSMEQQMSTVKMNVTPNEVAVGIDLSKMAIAPVGYNTYLTLAIKDVSFYAPRDIYPKQTPIDNARALKQMSSDRLHQEMINQQYQGR